MKNHISSTRQFAAVLAIAFLVLPTLAHAGLLEDVTVLLSSINKDKDESFGMLHAVLGDFVLDPFHTTDSTTGSLMASMFKELNMFIFSAACIWMAYNMLAGLAQTMHEGVVLGKRMSTVWVPIRVSFGTASLMPVFGGWAFAQALMVLAGLLGIAGANRVSHVAIQSTAAFQTTVNPMGGIKQAAQLHNIELYMARAVACQRASYDMAAAMQAAGQATPTDFPATMDGAAEGGTAIVMKFAGRQSSGQFGETACGQIKMKFSPRKNSGIGSMFGFRINDVNYEGIRAKAMEAHASTLNAVYQKAQTLIQGVSPGSTDAQFRTAVQTINEGFFGLYTNIFQDKLKSLAADVNSTSNSGAISQQLVQRMDEGGWATLGIWYAVFAETNEAMNEMLDPVVTMQDLSDEHNDGIQSTNYDIMGGLEAAIATASSMKAQPSTFGTATGNNSLGQWILGGLLDATAGASSTGYSNTVNPIIAYKNIGDNALATAQALYFAYKVADSKLGKAALGAAGKAASVAGSAIGTSIPVVGGIAEILSSIAEDAKGLLLPVLFLLFVTAAVMAFYIPLVPFIQWFAGLIQWFTSFIESLLGSTLWAMAHFDTDGEGMGQRTSYGWIYTVNVFCRPIIQTFAFFIASSAITVLGTFLFRYFGTAVASAQGNSLTGLMSIVAYLVIFCVMGLTLINSTFTMMLHLADRMVGWIGNNQHSAIGHDVEQRVAGVFINAARGGTGALESMARKQIPAGGGGGGGLAEQVMNRTRPNMNPVTPK